MQKNIAPGSYRLSSLWFQINYFYVPWLAMVNWSRLQSTLVNTLPAGNLRFRAALAKGVKVVANGSPFVSWSATAWWAFSASLTIFWYEIVILNFLYCQVITVCAARKRHLWRASLKGVFEGHIWGASLRGILEGQPWGATLRGIFEGHLWGASLRGILEGHPWGATLRGIFEGHLWGASLKGRSHTSVVRGLVFSFQFFHNSDEKWKWSNHSSWTLTSTMSSSSS